VYAPTARGPPEARGPGQLPLLPLCKSGADFIVCKNYIKILDLDLDKEITLH